MKETDAVEALAEYVVYKEMPTKARASWLADRINMSIQSCNDRPRAVMAAGGYLNQVAWCSLLDSKAVETIKRVLKEHDKSEE